MKRLFIIGNGFDVAHKLPTEYEDFHKFLLATYPSATKTDALVPQSSIGHHGEILYDDEEVVGYLLGLISRAEGDEWNNLETTLGELDFDDDFDELPEETDRDGERNFWHEAYNNEDLAAMLGGCVPMISSLFAEWVDTIEISTAKEYYDHVFAERADFDKDLFLSFNYTFTLEKIYGAKHVCHIHGAQGDKNLLFGHGAGQLFDEDNVSQYIGCEDGLEEIQDALRKDTSGAIEKNKSFFNALSPAISEIYSYGFSFGAVDLVYLSEIFNHLASTDITWYLHNHDVKKHDKQKKLINETGFCGHFGTFG